MDNRTADALIERISAGDMSALEDLYTQFSQAVYAYAMTIVKDKVVAEDIMQDVFVKVYQNASGFRAEGYGKAWILRIARNLALNAVTRRRESEPEEAFETLRAPDRPEDSAIIRVSLKEALDALSDEERRIVTLHAVSGMTLGEIAATLSQPLGTVKWKHAGALKKLRRAVGDM